MQCVNTFVFASPIYLPLHQWFVLTQDALQVLTRCECNVFVYLLKFFSYFWSNIRYRRDFLWVDVILTVVSRDVLLCSFSTNLPTENCVSPLIYFSEHTARCRKPLKTLLVILGSIHEFVLMFMFVIASFRCTLNSYFFVSSINGDANV